MKRIQKVFLWIPIILLLMIIIWIFLYSSQNKENEKTYIDDIYKYERLDIDKSSFDIVKITKQNIDKIFFYYKDKNNQRFEKINKLKKQNENLKFITNGWIFSEKFEPLWLYIENKKIISTINTDNGEWNFYIKPNGIFYIEENQAKIIKTDKYEYNSQISFAIQSWPLLVIQNKINSSFDIKSKNKFIRSGVGTDDKWNVIFAISNQAVTFYEFASLFKDKLNCKNALYLDGAISEMYIPGYREDTKEEFGVMIWILEK